MTPDLEAIRQRLAGELATGTAQWLDLPCRLRARFWFRHRIDGTAIWLAEHRHFRAATAVWRACRMW